MHVLLYWFTGKHYEWQLCSGQQWSPIANDHVIECNYCQPGARGITINTHMGWFSFSFISASLYWAYLIGLWWACSFPHFWQVSLHRLWCHDIKGPFCWPRCTATIVTVLQPDRRCGLVLQRQQLLVWIWGTGEGYFCAYRCSFIAENTVSGEISGHFWTPEHHTLVIPHRDRVTARRR